MARCYLLAKADDGPYLSGFETGQLPGDGDLPMFTPLPNQALRFESRNQLADFLKGLDANTLADLDRYSLVPIETEIEG